MSLTIVWDKKARSELDKLEVDIARRIILKVKTLSENPFSMDVKRLHGREDFRLRVGDYRVIFSIDGNNIFVLRVGHRKNIYES